MNKVFFGLLLISSVVLTGCEATSDVVQENTQVTDFSQKKNTSESLKSEKGLDISLSKNDLLYEFVNSGVIGGPADFDNFSSDENQSPDLVTNVSSLEESSSIGTNPNTSPNAFGDFFDSSTNIPADFDSFFSSSGQSSLEVGNFSNSNSDFRIDTERQEKIKIIKEDTITTQKNNIIANQIRNNDIDEQLMMDIVKIKEDLPFSEMELAQTMKNELKNKIRLLDAETALKVAELKMLANSRSVNIAGGVEDRVLNVTSLTGKELMKKMFVSEPDNYYQLKDQARRLEIEHQVIVARVKLEYQKKIDAMESDVKSLRVANKKIIGNRLAELEAQRIAEAIVVEQKIKAKNKIFVDGLYLEFKPKLSEYVDTVKKKISKKESQILERLKSTYLKEELARGVNRKSENRHYIADIDQQIKQEQKNYEDQSRDNLSSEREAKFDSIIKSQNMSINRIESAGAQKLATLKAQHVQNREKQKHTLQSSYKKKEQILNQKSEQARLKILARFNSDNDAIITKNKKETDIINQEIDARVQAEIRAALGSFKTKTVKKNTKTSKPSSGFFDSWYDSFKAQ